MSYARRVNKIIREVLALLWKLFKVVFWKWLKPLLGKFALVAAIVVAVIVAAVLMGRC